MRVRYCPATVKRKPSQIPVLRQHGPKTSPFYTLDASKTYPGLVSVDKVDDHTVRLVFDAPSPSAIQRLTNFGSPMVNSDCLDENGDFSTRVQRAASRRNDEPRATSTWRCTPRACRTGIRLPC